MFNYFRKSKETFSNDYLEEPDPWRLSARIIFTTFLVLLPFFQPGLGWLVAIIAFAKAAKRWGTLVGLAVAIAYTGFYATIAIYVLPYIHDYTVVAWQYVLLWGSALGAIILSTALLLQSRMSNWSSKTKVTAHLTVWLLALLIAMSSWIDSGSRDVLELTMLHAAIAAMIISTVLVLQGKASHWGSKTKTVAHTTIWGLALFIAVGSWLDSNTQGIAEWTMADELNPEVIDTLPNADQENFRMLPQVTALSYLQNLNGDTRTYVSEPHMSPCDSSGNQCWEGSIHLKGAADGIWYNFLGDTVINVATVDPTQVNMKGKIADGYDGFFLAGPNSWVVKAAFAVHNPFSEQQEALFWRETDHDPLIMLIPYISYRPTLTGVMVPELAGVMSVNRFGIINDMSPATAKAKYPNMPLYPTKLARLYAETYAKWNGGMKGRIFTKEHELRVSEPDSTGQPHFNKAPYIEVYGKNFGWQEVITLEPKGDESAKLTKILFFDAASGACKQYIVPNITLNGPRQAIIQVMQGNWNADWSQFQKVEPRPLITNNHIYYVVAVVSTAGTKHPYVHSVVIDGQTLKSYEVGDHDELFTLVDKLEHGISVQPLQVPIAEPSHN